MTPRQKIFVDEYIVTLNASEAARRAGYKPRAAQSTGSQLLDIPEIAAAIRDALAARAARTRVSADRVIEELARIAFSDIGRVVDFGPEGLRLKPNHVLAEADRAAIAELSSRGKGRLHVRLQDKQRALDALARHLGLYGLNAKLIAADPMERRRLADQAREKLRLAIERYAAEEAGKNC